MKKFFIVLGIIILIIVYIVSIFLTFNTSENNQLNKINIISQLTYTFVTIMLVSLTYFTLKSAKEQKNQTIMPYLVVNGVDLCNNEFEINIYNEGFGLAKDINVQVFLKEKKELLHTYNYARLSVQDDPIYAELYQIKNEINHIHTKRDENGLRYSPYIPSGLHFEFNIEEKNVRELNLIIEIKYSDIYNKKYKGIFDVKYDAEEDEILDFNEKFLEL